MGIATPAEPLSADLCAATGAAITEFLDRQRDLLAGIGPELRIVDELARLFTAGGKRMRPAFCFWGYVAAAGYPPDPAPLVRAAASLDLLHVSALVHDDLMDASDTRRGVPAAHRQLAAHHAASGWRGSSDAFGEAGAILLGDLLLVWSEQMFVEAGLPQAAITRALPYLAAVRTEVTCGQFLDISAAALPRVDGDRPRDWAVTEANRVVEYKTSKYTVERPLQIGAALAGADATLQQHLADYGRELGRAFQFRDDLLGVFGKPELTGKPAGDDLREGKLTVLIGHTLARADDATVARVDELLGDPGLTADEVAELREIVTATGARAAVESNIAAAATAARRSIESAPATADGKQALTELVELAVSRDL